MRAAVVLTVSWACGICGCASAPGPDEPMAHRAVLQIRAGDRGDRNRIDLAGRTSTSVDSVSKVPLAFQDPVSASDPVVAYSSGGPLPTGSVFVVTEVSYLGSSRGTAESEGEFWVSVRGESIARAQDEPLMTSGRWRGRLQVRAGEEHGVFVEVGNSSAGTMAMKGHLFDAESLPKDER